MSESRKLAGPKGWPITATTGEVQEIRYAEGGDRMACEDWLENQGGEETTVGSACVTAAAPRESEA